MSTNNKYPIALLAIFMGLLSGSDSSAAGVQTTTEEVTTIVNETKKNFDTSKNLIVRRQGFGTCEVGGSIRAELCYIDTLKCGGNSALACSDIGNIQAGPEVSEIWLLNSTVYGNINFAKEGGVVYSRNSNINGEVNGGSIKIMHSNPDIPNWPYPQSESELANWEVYPSPPLPDADCPGDLKLYHACFGELVVRGKLQAAFCDMIYLKCCDKTRLKNCTILMNIGVFAKNDSEPTEIYLENVNVIGKIAFFGGNGILYVKNCTIDESKVFGGKVVQMDESLTMDFAPAQPVEVDAADSDTDMLVSSMSYDYSSTQTIGTDTPVPAGSDLIDNSAEISDEDIPAVKEMSRMPDGRRMIKGCELANDKDCTLEGDWIIQQCTAVKPVLVKGQIYIAESAFNAGVKCENQATFRQFSLKGDVTISQTGTEPAKVYLGNNTAIHGNIIFPKGNGLAYMTQYSMINGKVIGGRIVQTNSVL